MILTIKKTFEGIFRDADGSLVNGGRDLRIWLKDFGNKLDCPGIQKAQEIITISFAQLYELVQESEAFDQTQKRRRGSDEVLEGRSRQKMVKRKTVRPSPEKPTTSDEERFKASEEEVEKQLSDQDGDYTPREDYILGQVAKTELIELIDLDTPGCKTLWSPRNADKPCLAAVSGGGTNRPRCEV